MIYMVTVILKHVGQDFCCLHLSLCIAFVIAPKLRAHPGDFKNRIPLKPVYAA